MNKTTILAVVGGAITLGFVIGTSRRKKNRAITADSKKDTFASHIADHDGKGLVTLSPGHLWHVTAKFRGNGPPWRRMIVYRPPGRNSLILFSPTAVCEEVMREIESLGTVEILLIPNSYHRTDAAVFNDRYVQASVACPPSWVRKAISEVVPVDMDARELENRYRDSIRVVRIGGLNKKEEEEGDFEYAYELRCADGTWAYVVTDTLFNFPDKSFMNWVFGCQGICHPDGSITPRVGRVSKWFMHSKEKCAEFYRSMAQRDDISMILLAHGNVLTRNVKEAFLAIAEDVSN